MVSSGRLLDGVGGEDRVEAKLTPEVVEEEYGLRSGLGGGAEKDLGSGSGLGVGGTGVEVGGFGFAGEGGSFGGDGDALGGTVGAAGQVGDGEAHGGGGENRARRGHAVEEPENFQLGFELVGDAIDDQVGVADGFLDGGDEGDMSLRG